MPVDSTFMEDMNPDYCTSTIYCPKPGNHRDHVCDTPPKTNRPSPYAPKREWKRYLAQKSKEEL